MKRILWFRRDLRIDDNPLVSLDGEVFPIFIFDTNILSKLQDDDRRVSMIYEFVIQLKSKLQSIGLNLKIFYGNPVDIFKSFNLYDFDEVVASGDYDLYAKNRDIEVSQLIHFRYIHDTYLLKANEVLKADTSPYLVFTPFYKKALKVLQEKQMTEYKRVIQTLYKYDYTNEITIESMGFKHREFDVSLDTDEKIKEFKTKLSEYSKNRDYLDKDAGSNLSIALRFGLVSVRKLYKDINGLEGSEAFIRQLIFRDYYSYLLFHFPSLAQENYKGRFNGILDEEKYEKFCTAKTGVPLVDAGVRELVKTGKMHNRVRMLVASFFTKDLLLPWQLGESFFAQYLLDYDAASNILSWQWSAGTGIDPQPYFRVFNPYLQSKKYDKDAVYIKKHVPELEFIEVKFLHNESYLLVNDINGYPRPILIHKDAAQVAIQKFKS